MWGVRSRYLMVMGRWSEDSSVLVAHSHLEAMSKVARDTSGEVGDVVILKGLRVGVFGLLSIV